MKKYLVLAVAAVAVGGCSDPTGSENLRVLPSTITYVPQIVRVGSDFKVTLTVSYGGCTAFRNFNLKTTDNRAEITAIGVEATGKNIACPDVLYNKPYDVTIPGTATAGAYTIIARQPSGPDATAQTVFGYPPTPGT